MGEVRVEALRAIAGMRRGEVREIEDTGYVQAALEAGHLRIADGGEGEVTRSEREELDGREASEHDTAAQDTTAGQVPPAGQTGGDEGGGPW